MEEVTESMQQKMEWRKVSSIVPSLVHPHTMHMVPVRYPECLIKKGIMLSL